MAYIATDERPMLADAIAARLSSDRSRSALEVTAAPWLGAAEENGGLGTG